MEVRQITLHIGRTLAATPPQAGKGGIVIAVLAQVSAHAHPLHKDPPPAPPETCVAYAAKTEWTGGEIAMIDLLIKDLGNELIEAEAGERYVQADYEVALGNSAVKCATDSKALDVKEGAKASLQGGLQSSNEALTWTGSGRMATLEYLSSLQGVCDWLLEFSQWENRLCRRG